MVAEDDDRAGGPGRARRHPPRPSRPSSGRRARAASRGRRAGTSIPWPSYTWTRPLNAATGTPASVPRISRPACPGTAGRREPGQIGVRERRVLDAGRRRARARARCRARCPTPGTSAVTVAHDGRAARGEVVGRRRDALGHRRAAERGLQPRDRVDRRRVVPAAQAHVAARQVADRDERGSSRASGVAARDRHLAHLGPGVADDLGREREPRRGLVGPRRRAAARRSRAARRTGATQPTTSLWSSSDIDAYHAGTLPFSFSWVFHRIAATAPIPSAPQITGTRSPIQDARSFAGFSADGTLGAELARDAVRRLRRPRRRRPRATAGPAASSAPSIANARCPSAARGCTPPGTPTTGSPRSAHRAASAPPPVIASIRHPRVDGRRERRQRLGRVPRVRGDDDERVLGPRTRAGDGARFTSTGTAQSRRGTRARSTSPATAEPPIPQTTTAPDALAPGRTRELRPAA